jgi:hypothetical protein
LLYSLTLTRKGLKGRELSRMVNLPFEKWERFYRFFGNLMVEEHGYFIICNKTSRTLIQRMVDPSREKSKTYRGSIVRSLKKDSVRLRDLEEIVYQLLQS